MRYRSVSTILGAILIFLFAIMLYIFFTYGGTWYFAFVPFAIAAIALLVFKSPIDRYFFKFQDVGFVEKIENMLKVEYPIIATYSLEKQKEFFDRLFFFMYERECYLVKEESDELDLYHSLIINAPGVILGMEGPVDEARDVERIAAYAHPFPSPKMKFLHAAEYDNEDGVIIVSLEQMTLSQRFPDRYFPINYFMWAQRKVAYQDGFPDIPAEFGEDFEKIWGFTPKSVEQFMGYELNDFPAVAICAYILRNEKLQQLYPTFTAEITNYMRA